MSLPVPRIEDPWQQRKAVFIAFGIIGVLFGILWIWGGVTTGQAHPAHILRVLHDGHGPVPPPGSTPTAPAPEIKLYGKVVDEFGAPIPDAQVRFMLRDENHSQRDIEHRSSADGTFSIHGQRSENLEIEIIKPGYTNIPFPSEGEPISSAEFHYTDTPSLLTLHTTAATPLILTLWRPPHSVGTAYDQTYTAKLTPDGTPRNIDVRDPASPRAVLHTIEIRYTKIKARRGPTAPNPYSWNAAITVPGGTLVEKAPVEILPAAPATGYLPRITLDFPATLPSADWKHSVTRHYYIRFSDNTHGILSATINARTDTIRGRLIRNPKPNDPDLTGAYIFK